jgi:hypothetical protein
MWMSGYAARNRPAEGSYSPLEVRAATFGIGARVDLVVIGLDLVGVDRETGEDLAAGVRESVPGLPRAGVVLNCSHTHCGPVVRDNLKAAYALDDRQQALVARYAVDLRSQTLAAVRQALADRRPAVLSYTVGRCAVAVNRRNNPEKDVPMLRTEGKLKGPVDHRVPVLAVHATDGKLRGVLFGYACHATTLDFYQWCGDYPGFARAALEAEHPGVTTVFLAGCGGDQNPLPRRSPELAKRYGADLANAVEAALQAQRKSLPPCTIAAKFQRIPLPFAGVPTRDELVRTGKSANRYEAARAARLLRELETAGKVHDSYPYPIQTVRFGPLAWVVLGGEVVVDYALGVEKEFGPNAWTFAYSNDVMAYVPSERVLAEGGYEGGGAMVYYGLPGPWKTGVERTIRNEVAAQLQGFSGDKR